jgi:hypothetical protein
MPAAAGYYSRHSSTSRSSRSSRLVNVQCKNKHVIEREGIKVCEFEIINFHFLYGLLLALRTWSPYIFKESFLDVRDTREL